MYFQERLQQLFIDSLEIKTLSMEYILPALEEASEALVGALLNGGKVLTCGVGNSSVNAQLLTTLLLNRFERERPGLPAFSIASDAITQSALCHEGYLQDVFAKQIQALGNPGDCLVLFTTQGNHAALLQAAIAAHDREMQVVVFSGEDGGDLPHVLQASDIEIQVPSDKPTRIREVHMLAIHALCDLIDVHIFGEDE
jgi:D-sedoheptulose 7-phosphate isomerase